jgi:hypothetical protein
MCSEIRPIIPRFSLYVQFPLELPRVHIYVRRNYSSCRDKVAAARHWVCFFPNGWAEVVLNAL